MRGCRAWTRTGSLPPPPERRCRRQGVLSLFIDRQESLWIGSEGSGLDRLQDGVWQHHGLASGLKGGDHHRA